MSSAYSAFKALQSRSLIASVSHSNIEQKLLGSTATPAAYCGFDPTAKSLHLGNLIQIITLRHLQKAGIRPILLVGGATGRIGDPTGRSEERVLLDETSIGHNIQGIRQSLSAVLDFDCEKYGAKVMDNYDWHGKMSVINWMQDVGRHFRVNSMIAKDSVKARMESEQGISFLEFSYMLFQGYDFLHLYERENCLLQIGGSDQWGNITAGIELIRKSIGKEAYGMTIPLLTTSTGEKYGKSAGNAVWLSEDMTSTYELYQYFMRSEDADVEQLLHTFTLEEPQVIQGLMEDHGTAPEKRQAQRFLAEYVTRMLHGEEGLLKAQNATSVLFGGSIKGLSAAEIVSIAADAPSTSLKLDQVLSRSIIDVATLSGLCVSKAECRRLIKSGGLYLNNNRVTDAGFNLTEGDLIEGKVCLLRSGRKNYRVVKVE